MKTLPSVRPPPLGRGALARRLGGALLLGAAAAGCGPSAPQVHVIQPLPRGVEPTITVTAAQQKNEIVGALRAAGFSISDRPQETAYLLRVTLGIDQGWQACGTLNNVRYSLRRDQQTVIEAEAKGWTGACQPNVFDNVSRALRGRIAEMTGKEGPTP